MSTTRCRTAALAAALIFLATGPAPAQAQNSLWQTYNDSGKQAYKAGEYAKAQKLLESALKEAEGFGPSDPRLATTLNNLAELYRVQARYDQNWGSIRSELGTGGQLLKTDFTLLRRTFSRRDPTVPCFLWERRRDDSPACLGQGKRPDASCE